MKKVSLLAVLLATVGITAASADVLNGGCPKAFQGFHLGANLGYGVGYVKNTSTEGPVSNKLGVSGIDGGIGTGYTHRFGNWAAGIAFDANWTNSKGKNARPDDINKVRLKNSLQLYARAGYVMRDIAMPFVGLGWDNSQWKVSHNAVSKSKRVNGLLWKAGVDFLATKHVVVGMEYTGTIAGRKSFVDGDATHKFKPQYNRFAATVKVVY